MATVRATLSLLVASDQRTDRQRLRGLLSKEPEITLVAECASGVEAVEAITEHLPDIVFLDIELPDLSGLEVMRTVPRESRPTVVFVTGERRHAADAFDLHAADYLIKPFSPARVRQALLRARALSPALSLLAGSTPPMEVEPPRLQRIIVPTGERRIVVSAEAVDWIESADNYAILHVGRDTHILRETLADLETRLARGHFFRISRGAIVNLDRVREIQYGDGESVIVLVGGTRLPVTRGIREVQARLENG